MCTANEKMAKKVAELVELKKMADDLSAEIEAIQDELKNYMDEIEEDTIQAGSTIVTYKPVVSKRLDSKGLKQLLGDALEPYYNTVVTKRFSIK